MNKGNVWLNRQQMADLFDRDVKTIGKHINNALKEELDNSVVANFATTASDGKSYNVEHYSLDMIISVKKLLKKHDYPPKGMDEAVQIVMTQCELWTDNNDMSNERVAKYAERLNQYVKSI